MFQNGNRGNNFNARSMGWTDPGTPGQVLTLTAASTPTWTTLTAGAAGSTYDFQYKNASAGASGTLGRVQFDINNNALGLGTTGQIEFFDVANDHFVGFKSSDVLTGSTIWTLPLLDGSTGQVLTTGGSGNGHSLFWSTPSSGGGGTPGGATYSFQYNNSGAFNGTSDFIYDPTNHALEAQTTSQIQFYEVANDHFVGFKAQNSGMAGSTTWLLPLADGTTGQVLTTSGAGGSDALYWSTPSGSSGGSSTLGVNLGGVSVSSPTAQINFSSSDFESSLQGSATAYISLNPASTDFIQNTTTLHSGTTFYVSSGTVAGPFNAGAFASSSATISGTMSVTSTATFTQSISISTNTSFQSYPLVFQDSLGSKINLYDGLQYGIGVNSGALEVYAPSGSRISMGTASGAGALGVTEVLSIGTNVGIGNVAPQTKLQLSSGVFTLDGTNAGIVVNSTPTSTTIPIVVKGNVSNNIDLTDWSYSAGIIGARINSTGQFSNPSISGGSSDETFGNGSLGAGVGSFDSFFGASAGAGGTIGNYNSGFGTQSLAVLSGGNGDTGTGAYSLFKDDNGNYNTANGAFSLFASTGFANTAVGYQSSSGTLSGSNNTMVGYLSGVTTTNANINVSRSSNTYIGSNTGQSVGYATIINGSIAIGVNATVSSSNTAAIGTYGGTNDVNLIVSSITTKGINIGSGHIVDGGSSPVLSSCGSSPAVTGADNAFRIVPGSSASGCTATFNTAFTSAPICTVSPETESLVNSLNYTVSNTAVTITQTSMTSPVHIICIGNKS